jgi:predicted ArsR family transcriptional regulator
MASKAVNDYLDLVAKAAAAEVEAVKNRDAAVRVARSRGATYAQLAQVLGVTPQAVQKRYGRS